MSENSSKALALSACSPSPWILYIYIKEPTELQELDKETPSAAMLPLRVTVLRI